MPFIGAGILGGGLLTYFGGRSQARAQQSIAEAQLQAAREAIAQQRSEREQALSFAGPSASILDMQSQMLDLSRQVLGRANRELQFLSQGLDVTSPGASEAGRGLFSEFLGRTRNLDRAKLESRLRTTLGPNYAATSAGQSALRQFDQQTADIGVQAIPQFLQTAYGAMQAPLTLEDAIKRRQIGAATGTSVAPLMFQSSQMAGAENVGSALRGQALGQLGSGISNIGGMALGNYMYGAGIRGRQPASTPMPTIGSTDVPPINFGQYFPRPSWTSQSTNSRFSIR
jgi:type II secretory pathway pseudopilin PulG